MLVLSRQIGQRIIIGEGSSAITLTVVSVKGNQIRLGVEAPRSVPVNREEVLKKEAA